MQRRKSKGFQKTASLLSNRFREIGEKRGFAQTRILTHWAEIVGQELARITKPVDVKYGAGSFGATLRIMVAPAHGPIVEMQRETIREKINAIYGYNAIARVQFTQTSPQGFGEAQASFCPASTAELTPDPAQKQKAEAIAQHVSDQGLRQALASLALNVLSKPKS